MDPRVQLPQSQVRLDNEVGCCVQHLCLDWCVQGADKTGSVQEHAPLRIYIVLSANLQPLLLARLKL